MTNRLNHLKEPRADNEQYEEKHFREFSFSLTYNLNFPVGIELLIQSNYPSPTGIICLI